MKEEHFLEFADATLALFPPNLSKEKLIEAVNSCKEIVETFITFEEIEARKKPNTPMSPSEFNKNLYSLFKKANAISQFFKDEEYQMVELFNDLPGMPSNDASAFYFLAEANRSNTENIARLNDMLHSLSILKSNIRSVLENETTSKAIFGIYGNIKRSDLQRKFIWAPAFKLWKRITGEYPTLTFKGKFYRFLVFLHRCADIPPPNENTIQAFVKSHRSQRR